MKQYIPKQNPNIQKEHELREERFRLEKDEKSKKKFKIISITGIILLIIGSLVVYSLLSPGQV